MPSNVNKIRYAAINISKDNFRKTWANIDIAFFKKQINLYVIQVLKIRVNVTLKNVVTKKCASF